MKILATLLSTALLAMLAQEAVVLHKRTVCRQDAWVSSVTLSTRALLTKHLPTEREVLPSCRILVTRKDQSVSWFRLPSTKAHRIPLQLLGKL